MKEVILTPEQNNATPTRIIVSNKAYKALRRLQYCGGFKRYGLDLYNDKAIGVYDSIALNNWLIPVFKNTPLIKKMI